MKLIKFILLFPVFPFSLENIPAGKEENFVDWKKEHRTPIYHLYWKNKRGSIEIIKKSKIPH